MLLRCSPPPSLTPPPHSNMLVSRSLTGCCPRPRLPFFGRHSRLTCFPCWSFNFFVGFVFWFFNGSLNTLPSSEPGLEGFLRKEQEYSGLRQLETGARIPGSHTPPPLRQTPSLHLPLYWLPVHVTASIPLSVIRF